MKCYKNEYDFICKSATEHIFGHWSRLKTSIKSIKWTFPRSICMFTFVCTCVYVHDQISIWRHESTMGNHDYVQSVAFVSMLKQESWSQIFTSLNQPVHLRSKGGQMFIFQCLWELWFGTSRYKCLYLCMEQSETCVFLQFIFTSFFKCIFVFVFVSATVTYASISLHNLPKV